MIMTPRLVILSVCVAFFSVIAGCSPTSSQEDVLDVVQPERIPERGEYNEKDMNNSVILLFPIRSAMWSTIRHSRVSGDTFSRLNGDMTRK